ncbi:MAG: 23S rRNA (adenine(1618)-N(6))-methyltransferase RlmF [Planctomycetota bacterium]|nr:MAG: 23S rRNA (adenine(1618)-N(6))-methyltransferase RlmF [Planctomycetota bacterium]
MHEDKKQFSIPNKRTLHPNNRHNQLYDFEVLINANPELEPFVFTNEYGTRTIHFSSPEAVLQLNKTLLKQYYQVDDWSIPEHYLCPPIPGRANYIHYLADLLADEKGAMPITGLDIGVGANCIYPILGAQIYNWKMVGTDIDEQAITSARKNARTSDKLKKHIDIRHQKNNANIFEGIILENEYYHFTMCNPPFHVSENEASKGTLRKLKNLQKEKPNKKELVLNFGGQANELWCNGGEALFIKRMIKQSVAFKTQVSWFTTLVSKSDHLKNIYKQLNKLNAIHNTITMSQGKKQSRFVAWKF